MFVRFIQLFLIAVDHLFYLKNIFLTVLNNFKHMKKFQINSTDNFFPNHFQMICWHGVPSALSTCLVHFLQTKALTCATLTLHWNQGIAANAT